MGVRISVNQSILNKLKSSISFLSKIKFNEILGSG